MQGQTVLSVVPVSAAVRSGPSRDVPPRGSGPTISACKGEQWTGELPAEQQAHEDEQKHERHKAEDGHSVPVDDHS